MGERGRQTREDEQLNRSLAELGLRVTSQRKEVYTVLLEDRDHPTAEQVFIRTKNRMPEISMATVYNCLDTLVKCGLVREVNLDRAPTRYCPNMQEHCHFYCEVCGQVFDIDFRENRGRAGFAIPEGFKPKQFEVSIRGCCPKCNGMKSSGELTDRDHKKERRTGVA